VVWWLVVAAGWALMVWAIIGLVGEQTGGQVRSWVVWLVAVAVLDDVVLVPFAVLIGVGLSRFGPSIRRPARWAAATIGVVALATLPIVARFGASSDNDSLLPLPAGRNLVLIAVAIVVVAAGATVALSRSARGGTRGDGLTSDGHEPKGDG